MGGDWGKFRVCQPTEYLARFARGEYLGAVGLDVISKPSREHVCGKVSFQFALANEKDDGMKTGLRKIEKFLERLRVSVILMQGVLKLEFLTVNGLGPLRRSFIPENPTAHVFRFDDEDPVKRNEDMVDLGCSSLCRENQIVNASVGVPIEPDPHPELSGFLSEPAFDESEHARLPFYVFLAFQTGFFPLSRSPCTGDSSIILKVACFAAGFRGTTCLACLKNMQPTTPTIDLTTVGPWRTAVATALSARGRMMWVWTARLISRLIAPFVDM